MDRHAIRDPATLARVRALRLKGFVIGSELVGAVEANDHGIAIISDGELDVIFRYTDPVQANGDAWYCVGGNHWGLGYGSALYINVSGDRLATAYRGQRDMEHIFELHADDRVSQLS